jgi:hypothetical protein
MVRSQPVVDAVRYLPVDLVTVAIALALALVRFSSSTAHDGGDQIGEPLQKLSQSRISWWRFASMSPRRYAASTLLSTTCAIAISRSSFG